MRLVARIAVNAALAVVWFVACFGILGLVMWAGRR